jgi:hypothetical protein
MVRLLAPMLASLGVMALLLAPIGPAVGQSPTGAADRADDAAIRLDDLMAMMAAVPERRGVFHEVKHFAALAIPLESSGHLIYRRPGYLAKITDAPQPESMVVDGDEVSLTEASGQAPNGEGPKGQTAGGQAPSSQTPNGQTPNGRTPNGQTPNGQTHVIDLASQPELRILVDAMRGPLSGDGAALKCDFRISVSGTRAAWRLDLTPIDPRAARLVAAVHITGAGSEMRDVLLVQANGDSEDMSIEPAP